jgi:hypothetical protein
MVLKSIEKAINFSIKAFESHIIGSCFPIKTIVDLRLLENLISFSY